jgi:hypothetical protein
MKHAFEKAGMTAAGANLYKDCCRYFNHGGTILEFDRVVAQARLAMVGSGHDLADDHPNGAASHQPNSEPGGHGTGDTHMVAAPSARNRIPGSEGHRSCDAQTVRALADQEPLEDDAGQTSFDAHTGNASPSSSREGEEGQECLDAQLRPASSPSPTPDGKGQVSGDSHPPLAPPVRVSMLGHNRPPIVNPPRRLEDMKRTKAIVRPSIFETCTIRNEPLAAMSRGRLKRMRFTNLYEAELARLILNVSQAPDDTLVPDLVSGDVLSKMILDAQEIANAA